MINKIPSEEFIRDRRQPVAKDPAVYTASSVPLQAGCHPEENKLDAPVNKSREVGHQNADRLGQIYSNPNAPSSYIMEINQLPFPTIICDTENKIMSANDSFQDLTGFSESDYTGKNLKDLLQPGRECELLPQTEEFISSGKDILQSEIYLQVKGKAPKYVLLQSRLIKDLAGAPQQILIQMTDLTKRKEEEEFTRKKTAELEKFVYSTSHDLRAPLRSIMGLVYIIQQETNQEAIRTYLDMIRSSINRMDNFIKEIVDLSRNSRQPVNKEAINLEGIVTEIFDSLRFIPGAEKIDFILNIKQSRPFYSDISRIKVVLNNLISNAIAYHRTQQEHPFIEVSINTTPKYCHIDVVDNGRGIQKEHQAKIFDMFYRASDDSKGSGLGLYIVKEAVQKLNGEIRIKSTWGEGTRFSLKFFNHTP
jgi:PAS domain S-box-containing protein